MLIAHGRINPPLTTWRPTICREAANSSSLGIAINTVK
jgi:hypothetical protein